MGIVSGFARKLKATSIGKRYQEAQEEKKWKEGLRIKAKAHAKEKAEELLMKKYENEETEKIVAGKKKSNFMQKLGEGFGNQKASSKVEMMLGAKDKSSVGIRNEPSKQPKSMTEKILGNGGDKTLDNMFGENKINRMLSSDNKEKNKIKKTAKKHIPEKEFSFSDKIDKMF